MKTKKITKEHLIKMIKEMVRTEMKNLVKEDVQDKMDLSDQELAALHSFIMYKAFARKENLAEIGVEYSLNDPTVAALIEKGFLKLRGKALVPNREMIRKELAKHEPPKSYPRLENAFLVFKRPEQPLYPFGEEVGDTKVWPKDIKLLDTRWAGARKELRLFADFEAQNKVFHISTPLLDSTVDEKKWIFSMRFELSQLLRKGRSSRLLDPTTGKPATPEMTDLRIV